MAGTKPRMTKQHTRAAALPGKPCFPTGAARCKRHPDSGAAGSAGALFCTRALSFASENDLMQVLGLIPGAVTPLGACRYAECLLAAGAGAALHLYPSGGHGFGLRREFAWREALVGELRMWLDATIGTV